MSKFTVGCNFNGCVWMNDAETRKQADRLATQHMELCQGHEVYILDNVKAREAARKSLGRRLCRKASQQALQGLVDALRLALEYDNDPGRLSTWAEMQDITRAALDAAKPFLEKK